MIAAPHIDFEREVTNRIRFFDVFIIKPLEWIFSITTSYLNRKLDSLILIVTGAFPEVEILTTEEAFNILPKISDAYLKLVRLEHKMMIANYFGDENLKYKILRLTDIMCDLEFKIRQKAYEKKISSALTEKEFNTIHTATQSF